MNAAIKGMDEKIRRKFDAYFWDADMTIQVAEETENLQYGLATLYQEMLQNKLTTAWVAAKDPLARAALYFLDSKGISVPGDISLVGFDNTTLSAESGITSYDFAFQAMARRIFSFILYPSNKDFSLRGQRIECGGMLMKRRSVRRMVRAE
jgi:DNA-binding LacI/PurR family transcriptional regulator